MSDIIIHTKTYDSLADEYESRVEKLTPITKESVDICSKYLKPGDKVLDVGCAVGLAIKCFSDNGFIASGIELSSEMVAYAKRRNPTSDIMVGDFLEYKFNEKFNAVYMGAFIHLFPKNMIDKLFEKIQKVLQPRGYIFLSTTKSDVSKEGYEKKYDYEAEVFRFIKHWTENELEDTVKNCGFEILNKRIFTDPLSKIWIGLVAKSVGVVLKK